MLLGSQLSNKLSPACVSLSRPFSGAEKTEDMKILRMWVQKSGSFDEILPGTWGHLPPSLLKHLMISHGHPKHPFHKRWEPSAHATTSDPIWGLAKKSHKMPTRTLRHHPGGKSKEPDCFTAKTPTYAHGLGHETFHPHS